MKTLVIDDNERMRRTIRSVIADISDEFFECEDGAGAVRAYERHQPDWVTMDIRMKDIDGIEATRRITERFPDARVVIVTEVDDTEVRSDSERAGACGFVLKRSLFELRDILTK